MLWELLRTVEFEHFTKHTVILNMLLFKQHSPQLRVNIDSVVDRNFCFNIEETMPNKALLFPK